MYLIKHWKTTLVAIIILTFTALVPFKIITVDEWVIAMGTLGTTVGLLAKDWDKTNK